MSRIVVEIKDGILWSVMADQETEVLLFDRDVQQLEDFTGSVRVDPKQVQRAIDLLSNQHRIALRRL